MTVSGRGCHSTQGRSKGIGWGLQVIKAKPPSLFVYLYMFVSKKKRKKSNQHLSACTTSAAEGKLSYSLYSSFSFLFIFCSSLSLPHIFCLVYIFRCACGSWLMINDDYCISCLYIHYRPFTYITMPPSPLFSYLLPSP